MSPHSPQFGRSDPHTATSAPPADRNPARSLDVIIVGSGTVGLTLAIQLKQDHPALSVTVLEDQPQGVPTVSGPRVSDLGAQAGSLGVAFLSDHRVAEITPSNDDGPHELRIWSFPEEFTLRGRWVVDASSRAALTRPGRGQWVVPDHRTNAIWLHVADAGVDPWSVQAPGSAQIEGGLGSFIIDCLQGEGYRAWIMRSSGGSIGLGVVADASIHAPDGFDTFETALQWLETHAPEGAVAIRAGGATVDDFRIIRDYDETLAYLAGRWCLSGDLVGSGDLPRSSETDLMMIRNGLLTDLIGRDCRGDNLDDSTDDRPVGRNQLYPLVSQLVMRGAAVPDRAVPLMRPA